MIERLGSFMKRRTVARGGIIFAQGDVGTGLMGVLAGSVKISVASAKGRHIVLNTIHAGDVFGEIALLDGHPRTADATAIFAFNDNIAIGAVQAARARGLRVPDDLSIVGFDDVEHATIVTPALTTVRQPLAEMGRTAVSLLSRLMERQSLETLHVELATRLVVRDSTAPLGNR